MPDTRLDSLDPRFQSLAIQLLARLIEARVPVFIVNTFRTQAEQDAAIAQGVSWVAHSLHQDGLAIDVAPYDTYTLHGSNKALWNTHDPIWLKIGAIGEALSLRWGGRFTPVNSIGVGKDPGHFEYVTPAPLGVPV